MFDNEVGTVMISTSDTALFETMLTLTVMCTSIASKQQNNTATDVFTVKFEDPCQFDKVYFENKAAIEDYYIYYVEASTAKDVIIDYGFTQNMDFCKSICSLIEADNEKVEHPAIQMFDEKTGTIMISTSDTSLIDTSLSL